MFNVGDKVTITGGGIADFHGLPCEVVDQDDSGLRWVMAEGKIPLKPLADRPDGWNSSGKRAPFVWNTDGLTLTSEYESEQNSDDETYNVDEDVFMTAKEARGIGDLLDALNRFQSDSEGLIGIGRFRLFDENNDTLGHVDFNDTGYAFFPGGNDGEK